MGSVEADVTVSTDEPRRSDSARGKGAESSPSGAEPSSATQEHLFRLLVEGVKDYAIFMLDSQGRVATWNPGAERTKGYRRDEIIGKHFSVFYPPEERERSHRSLRLAESEGKFEEEAWRVRKDGSRFWAHVVLTAIRENGQLVGFAKVTRDLTERRKAEQERIRLARSEEAIRLRDEFLAVAAHEFKTPLQNLKLQMELLGRLVASAPSELAEQMWAKIDAFNRQVDRLQMLNTRLLDLSALRAGQLPLRLEPVELGPAIRSQVQAMSVEFRRARCDVRMSDDPGISAVVDRSMFAVVLHALLSNACKYGESRPIDISTGACDEKVSLTIVDHGIGIAVEDLERIFGKFERAVSAENYAGWGLGLFIARQLVEQMGGSIQVTSTRGRGSRFLVTLKRADLGSTEGRK